jgi:hypothetical protein
MKKGLVVETPTPLEQRREQTGHTQTNELASNVLYQAQKQSAWTAILGEDEKGWDVEPLNLRDPELGYGLLHEANARLIAAAPELLEMLKAALPLIDDATQDARRRHGNGSQSDLALTKQAKATRIAISKAEGK